jgi:hypothetical protein
MEGSIFELARRDHQRHLTLIERVQGETSESERARGMARLAADWRRHSQAEHAALLAFLMSDGQSRPLARQAVAAHGQLERAVSDLADEVHHELELAVALSTYRSRFMEYMRFEEEELFPAAMLALGNERPERLADRYRAAVQATHAA